MIRFLSQIVAALVLVNCCRSIQAEVTEEHIVDYARQLCKRPEVTPRDVGSVTSITDVIRLVDFFETLPDDHELDACRDRYIESMSDLHQVLTTGNGNVCSEEKISQLETFNRRYISTVTNDIALQKEENLKAPKLIRRFFMHFGFKINQICKESLLETLGESPYSFGNVDGKPADLSAIDQMLQEFQGNFSLNVAKHGYKDLVLPWKVFESFPIKKRYMKHLQEVVVLEDDEDGDHSSLHARISIRLNRADKIDWIQRVCRTQLKPEYSGLGLPILRLTSLGLYEEGDHLATRLATDPNLQRFFGIIQICETLLRIEAFQDDSLERGKIIAMTKEKAAELRAKKSQREESQTVETNSVPVNKSHPLGDVDEIETLSDPVVSKKLAHAFEANRRNQEAMLKRIMNTGLSLLRAHIKSKAISLFSNSHSRSSQNTEIEIEGASFIPDDVASERVKRNIF